MVCQTFLPKYDELLRTRDASLWFSETSPTESRSHYLSISSSRACIVSQRFRIGVGQSFERAIAQASCPTDPRTELFSRVLPGCFSAQVSRQASSLNRNNHPAPSDRQRLGLLCSGYGT